MGVGIMKKEIANKFCLICGHEFSYHERFQSSYRLFWRMDCKGCGTRYSVLDRYQYLFYFVMGLAIFAGPMLMTEWGAWNVFLAYGIYIVLMSALALLVIPLLPLKLDLAQEQDTPLSKGSSSEVKSE
jgi:CXXC-20-CXXC protein